MKIIEICECYYPETLGKMIIVNAPRIFALMWPLVQAVINENTKEKFLIYPKSVTEKFNFEEHIPKQYIPEFLNGDIKLPFDNPPSPFIPKNLYIDEIDQDVQENIFGFTYKPFVITKTHRHDVYLCFILYILKISVQIDEPDHVITWDFDVLEGSVKFLIEFCTSKECLNEPKVFNKVPHHQNTVYKEGSSIQVFFYKLFFLFFVGITFM